MTDIMDPATAAALQEQKNAFATSSSKQIIDACTNPHCKFVGCTCGRRCGCNRGGCTNPNCTCAICTCPANNTCQCGGGNTDPDKALDQSCDPCQEFKAQKQQEAQQQQQQQQQEGDQK